MRYRQKSEKEEERRGPWMTAKDVQRACKKQADVDGQRTKRCQQKKKKKNINS